jgi:photosynthetic reaction center cytochrome c subunit
MKVTLSMIIPAALVVVAAAAVIAVETERPPMESVQRGYRGVGQVQIFNPRTLAKQEEANVVPESLPSFGSSGPPASQIYENVQVLKDVSVGEFTRLMASMTTWVAPDQGCAYCHNTENMASDAVYTKVVARRMLQMVKHINADWKSHVAETGVTCYTCHRGQPVPAHYWFLNPGPSHPGGMVQAPAGKNLAATSVGLTSLPYDPFTPFLQQDNNIRVTSPTALPTGDRQSIKQTDWTYGLMIHMSTALGVNCTYCHNSRQFADWSQSSPQRAVAWYGIRMVRDLNNSYLDPLKATFPANRLGPMGDPAKVNCTTCHIGVYKPLFGVSMAKDFPELQR